MTFAEIQRQHQVRLREWERANWRVWLDEKGATQDFVTQGVILTLAYKPPTLLPWDKVIGYFCFN